MMKSRINRNLISLKCVIFAFFAGLGCLFPFLALHMVALGLTRDEARVISIVAPCVAALGPIVAGLLLDRLSIGRGGGNNSSNVNGSGRLLRFILAGCLLLAALFYGLLLSVPAVTRLEARRPSVSFSCSSKGAVVMQERCTEEKTCYNWDGEKSGSLRVSECAYACEAPPVARDPIQAAEEVHDVDSEVNLDFESTTTEDPAEESEIVINPPHLCHDVVGEQNRLCQVYTTDTKQLIITAQLLSGTQNNETDDEEWCSYPLAQYFQCIVPETEVESIQRNFNGTCNPIIVCQVDDPYDSPNSVLAESQCMQLIGDPNTTFWTYLVLRSIADIFPTTALGLVGTACVIATRETSLGRGDVGRQLAFGAIGLAIFPPLLGLNGTQSQTYVAPIVVFILFMILAAIILLADSSMPLSPPEWWWHTECGMLAMPMSSVRRYSTEIAAVAAILVLLGTFWGGLDNYLSWTLQDLHASDLLIGLTLTFGAIPAIPVLWWAERVVDYCGHSNLLITAFTFYIFRYTGMALVENPNWVLLFEALEVFTLSLAWVTAVLYLRHLVPRKFTSTGQAVPVVAHFCIGRCIGAIIGGFVSDKDPSLESVRFVYRELAVAAFLVAALYMAFYHLLLAPRCRAPSTGSPVDMLQGLNQNGRSNGGYDQLRVYHNERGRKGQFRY